MSTTTHPPTAMPITRQTRALLQRLDDANCSLNASQLCRRKPFVGLYSAEELATDVLAPLLAAGLVSVRELRRCEKVYTITDSGLDALQAPDAAPAVAAPRQSNIFASVLDHLAEWPVASLRGCHPNIRSRGF